MDEQSLERSLLFLEAVKVSKTPYRRYGQYQVYLVDEAEVRDLSLELEEFTDYAVHEDFPDLIPAHEIWVGREVKPEERWLLIASALAELKARSGGAKGEDAYRHAMRWQRKLRRRAHFWANWKPDLKPPRELYKGLYASFPGGINAYNIDGEMVRDIYDIDFVEGGNAAVYQYVPGRQLWVEYVHHAVEKPYIVLHEFGEMLIKQLLGISYDQAHDAAAMLEYEYRLRGLTKEQLESLTPKQVFQQIEHLRDTSHGQSA